MKPFEEETRLLVEHIREKTQGIEDKWVTLGHRDIPKIAHCSTLYSRKMLELIKHNANVIYEIDENFPTRYKPYKYRYGSREEKLDFGLSARNFFSLHQEEIDYIRSKIKIQNYAKMFTILSLCNILASSEAREYFIKINIKELADLTISNNIDTEKSIEQLISKGLLVQAKHETVYKLALDPSTHISIIEEANQKIVCVKQKKPRKKRIHIDEDIASDQSPDSSRTNELFVEDCRAKMLDSLPANMISLLPSSIDNKNALSRVDQLIGTIANMSGMLDELKQSATIQVSDLVKLRDREEEINFSYDTFQKLLKENDAYREEQFSDKERIRKLENEQKKLAIWQEGFIMSSQAQLDMMLGEVSGAIDEFVKRPTYEQRDVLVAARLKKSVWGAVTNTSNLILSYKPEVYI